MNQKTAEKLIKITKNTYDLIGGDFAHTRVKPWPEMENLVQKYIKDGMNVLDVGCGNARLLGVLKGYQLDYLGIDDSASLIHEARKKIDNWEIKKMGQVECKKMDIFEINKLEDESYDVVFMFASFNHIPSEQKRVEVIESVWKKLKPGGVIVMTNWNLWQISKTKKSIWRYKLNKQIHGEENYKESLEEVKEELGFRDVLTFWQSRDREKSGGLYYRALTRFYLGRLLRDNGFRVIENYYSLDYKKSMWWKGKNIVTVGRKK